MKKQPDKYELDIQHVCSTNQVPNSEGGTITVKNNKSDIVGNGTKRVQIRAEDSNDF